MKKARRQATRGVTAVDVNIGARIRESRLAAKMTQADLAKELGISFQQLQKYEKGSNRISAARLYQICKLLEVEISSMFEP